MRTICLIFLLFAVTSSIAQESGAVIKGKVNSEEQPVPFANIGLRGTSWGTASDENGYFKINNIPSGEYELVISSLGYRKFSKKLQLKNKDTVHIDAALEQSAHDLDQVVVTGTMRETFIRESPVKVEVINAKLLEKNQSDNIMEAVHQVNGIDEQVDCGVCFTNNIRINGLDGPYTMVLVDGMPMYSNLATVYGLNSISSSLIKQIEVIKGPSSTLYGSEAVAGVINIITKDPADLPLMQVNTNISYPHGEWANNISFAKEGSGFSTMLSFDHFRMHNFIDDNEDLFSDIVNLDRYSLFNKWSFQRKNNRRFEISAKVLNEDRRGGVESFLDQHKDLRGSDSIYGESIYTRRYELFGTYDLPVGGNYRIDFSASHHDQDSYYGADHYKANQQVYYSNLVHHRKIGELHQLTGGLTLRYNAYDDNTVATSDSVNSELVNSPDNQFIPGIFLQDEYQPFKKLSVLGGIRMDHYDHHGLIFSPRLNFKYQPSQWSTIRANFGTGFRIVHLFTEDHAFVSGSREVLITEDLRPERSYNGTLNYNHLINIGHSAATFDTDLFYTYFTNSIDPDYSNQGKIIYSNTNGYKISKGISLSFNQNFTFPLSYSLGVTFMRVTVTEQDENGNYFTHKHEFSPDWSGVFGISYEWKKAGLKADYTGRIVGPMTLPAVYDVRQDGTLSNNPRPLVSDPYTIQNIRLSRNFGKGVTLYAGIKNIFDWYQQTPLVAHDDPTAPPGFSDYFDTAYAYAPIHGRDFYLGLNWKIGE